MSRMRVLTLGILICVAACGETKTPAEPSPDVEAEPSPAPREAKNVEPSPPAPKPLPPPKPEFASARLWIPGSAGPDDDVPKDRTKVLALCGDTLQEGTVRVEAVRGDPGGHELQGPCDAIALFEGVSGLKAGPVASAKAELTNLDESSIELSSDVRLRSERAGESYAVFLDAFEDSWVLADYETTDGGIPKLIWAGDLDADGRLDLLVDLPPKYSVSLVRLYLSSAAPERPLAQVAELRRVVD
jgi:hypothetical protein